MSLERRFALLHAAEQAGAWIIEDDYDGEFSFGGKPLPTLKSVDATGLVIYVGTFSKSLFPSLRLGFLLAPPALVDTLRSIMSKLLHGVPSLRAGGRRRVHRRRPLRVAPAPHAPHLRRAARRAVRRRRGRASPACSTSCRARAACTRSATCAPACPRWRWRRRRRARHHRLADRALLDRAGAGARAGAGLRRRPPGGDRGGRAVLAEVLEQQLRR